MIVGVPIFAIFYATIKALVNRSLRKKNLPLDTGLYNEVDYVDEEGNFLQIEEELLPAGQKRDRRKKDSKKEIRFIKIPKKVTKAEDEQTSQNKIDNEK